MHYYVGVVVRNGMLIHQNNDSVLRDGGVLPEC